MMMEYNDSTSSSSPLINMEHDEQSSIRLSPFAKTIAISLYSTMGIIAAVGNSLIVMVIIRFRRMRNPTNLLILNLAIADLLIALLCMPISYWHVIIFDDQRWIFGRLFCKIFPLLQGTAVFLNAWTLVVISFDRFVAIMWIFRPSLRLTRRKALILVMLTWCFSLLMALPMMIVHETHLSEATPGRDRVIQCAEFGWINVEQLLGLPRDTLAAPYSLVLLILQYCFPLLVLMVTYTGIGFRMWFSRVPTENGRWLMQRSRQESVKKLIPMVLLVSLAYACCWAPQNLLMNILLPLHPDLDKHRYILYFWWLAHSIAMSHSMINPVLYWSRNERFREGFRYYLRFLPCVHFTGLNFLADRNRRNALRIVNAVAYMPVSGKTIEESPPVSQEC